MQNTSAFNENNKYINIYGDNTVEKCEGLDISSSLYRGMSRGGGCMAMISRFIF